MQPHLRRGLLRSALFVVAALLVCWLGLSVVNYSLGTTTNLITMRHAGRIETLVVREGNGAILWQLDHTGTDGATEIRYGTVPAGYRQSLPVPPELPRELRQGEELKLELRTERGTLVQDIWPMSKERMRLGVALWTPRGGQQER